MRSTIALFLLLSACPSEETTSYVDETPSDTGDMPLDTGAPFCEEAPVVTWENFGAGFITESCQSCHASSIPNRQGAPSAAVFDTEQDVLDRADRILSRVVDEGDMPPQGGVTEDDRYLLEVWLGCP